MRKEEVGVSISLTFKKSRHGVLGGWCVINPASASGFSFGSAAGSRPMMWMVALRSLTSRTKQSTANVQLRAKSFQSPPWSE